MEETTRVTFRAPSRFGQLGLEWPGGTPGEHATLEELCEVFNAFLWRDGQPVKAIRKTENYKEWACALTKSRFQKKRITQKICSRFEDLACEFRVKLYKDGTVKYYGAHNHGLADEESLMTRKKGRDALCYSEEELRIIKSILASLPDESLCFDRQRYAIDNIAARYHERTGKQIVLTQTRDLGPLICKEKELRKGLKNEVEGLAKLIEGLQEQDSKGTLEFFINTSFHESVLSVKRVCWIEDFQQVLIKRYGDVLLIDATFGTNDRGLKLFIVA